MNKRIPLSVPNISEIEYSYATTALKDNWVSTSGSFINDFENRLARYIGAEGLVACQSGTAAIHLALLLAGVNSTHEVIVPSLTFIASVNPVRYVGASPIFMDCDDTLNMDIDKLESFLKNNCTMTDEGLINNRTKKRVKALIVVHVFGNMMRLEKVVKLAREYGLLVIEDATEALGSYQKTGDFASKYAGTIGDFSAYSFNGNKIITTGGGGMLWCREKDLLDRGRYLSTQAKDDRVNYIHHEVGYNYRMTNLQAALGLGQLERLEGFIDAKKRNYDIYKEGIDEIRGLRLMEFNEGMRHNYWFYSLYVDEEYGESNLELIERLGKEGIEARPIWGIICDQKPYEDFERYLIDKSRFYRGKIVNIPCSTDLKINDIHRVLDALKK